MEGLKQHLSCVPAWQPPAGAERGKYNDEHWKAVDSVLVNNLAYEATQAERIRSAKNMTNVMGQIITIHVIATKQQQMLFKRNMIVCMEK